MANLEKLRDVAVSARKAADILDGCVGLTPVQEVANAGRAAQLRKHAAEIESALAGPTVSTDAKLKPEIEKALDRAFLEISKSDPHYRKIYAEQIETLRKYLRPALASPSTASDLQRATSFAFDELIGGNSIHNIEKIASLIAAVRSEASRVPTDLAHKAIDDCIRFKAMGNDSLWIRSEDAHVHLDIALCAAPSSSSEREPTRIKFEDEITQRDGVLCLRDHMFDMFPENNFKRGDRVCVTLENLTATSTSSPAQEQPPRNSPMQSLVNALNDPRWAEESTALARDAADRARKEVAEYLERHQTPQERPR